MTPGEKQRRQQMKQDKAKKDDEEKKKQTQIAANVAKASFFKHFHPNVASKSTTGTGMDDSGTGMDDSDDAKLVAAATLPPSSDDDHDSDTDDANNDKDNMPTAEVEMGMNEATTIQYPSWHGRMNVKTVNPNNTADLDWDEEDDNMTDPGDETVFNNLHNATNSSTGVVMTEYLRAIQKTLRKELKQDGTSWLIPYLKQHEFWIRAEASAHVCFRLGVKNENDSIRTDRRVLAEK
ncbi:MAG TPA: hypothetical protein VLS94_08380 [Fusibacter sp.]|nr:hypothetical protein [Fusibacter sp.]